MYYKNRITQKEKTIQISNPNDGDDKSFREFRIPNHFSLPLSTAEDRVTIKSKIISPICQWLCDGFSVNIIAYGQRGTGKTSFYFEPPTGLLFTICNSLLRLKTINSSQDIELGISIYELRHSDFFDLLSGDKIINNTFTILQYNEYKLLLLF